MIKIILVLTIICAQSYGSKLNFPRVLLPLFNDFSTNFTLEVSDTGCYTWSTLRPNIVRLQCLDTESETGCCSQMVVSGASKELRRNTETVLAEDVHSGLVLRCEVILDVINSLSIVTTTREIFLDESPQIFEVRAYDDQGNEFSTLEGVEMDWSFRTLGMGNKTGESTVVRFLTFAESLYETPKAIQNFERLGIRGNIILLEGKQTGAASVTVRLPQKEYSEVPSAGVQLLVVTNLIITPPDATLLLGDRLNYRLRQFQRGRMSEIAFPSAQYHLVSEDRFVEVDRNTGVATGLAIGTAKIVMVDDNVAQTDIKPPSATLSVAEPAELTLAILPTRKWSVVTGQQYDIVAELYDSDRKRFHFGDAAVIDLQLDESYFRVVSKPRNGSYLRGTPTKIGRVQVTGELLGVRDPLGGVKPLKDLTARGELNIYSPIVVSPPLVLLPWDPVMKARYEVQLSATGGDGVFTWSSLRSAVAVVTQRGLIRSLEQGVTTVVAAMSQNPAIRGVSTVRVLPPLALEILDEPLEAEVDSFISIQVALYADVEGERHPFTLCDALPFQVTLSDSNFAVVTGNSSQLIRPACTSILVSSSVPGTSTVTISYGGLSATAVLAAHKRLAPLNPSSGVTLLSVGTSRWVVFTGGPRSWAAKPSELRHNLQNPDTAEKIEVDEGPKERDFYAYRVSCRELSETVLTLHVANKVLGSKASPSKGVASVTVICGKPKFLMLANVNAGRCPLQQDQFVSLCYKELDVEVIVKDVDGRKFDNITSLEFSWLVSKPSLASIALPGVLKSLPVVEEGFIFPGTFLQTLMPAGRPGAFQIEGKITGYNQEVLFSQSITAESPPFPEFRADGTSVTPRISASLNVLLVEAATITPNRTEILAGGSDTKVLHVTGGSGQIVVTSKVGGVVDVEVLTEEKKIQVAAREVGSTELAVEDVCLDTDPVLIPVQVYRLGGISLEVPEFVEKGKTIRARVILYDEEGARLSTIPDPAVIQLTPNVGSDVITVRAEEGAAVGEFYFIVRGVALGRTVLSVSAGDVKSREADILVFPPLKVNPRNVTLLVGASLQVTTTDGPPAAHLEFFVEDPQTAKVSADGIVEGARIGQSLLTVRAVIIRKESGAREVASTDHVQVLVVPLKGVTIQAPITRIVAGGRMPLWAVGPPGSAALLRLGSNAPLVSFYWSLSQDCCAEIRTVFRDLGVHTPQSELVAVRFFAHKPGRVSVTLVVQVPGQLAGTGSPVEYTDSLVVEIIPATALSNPKPMTLEHLLVSPLATTELRTTRDINRYQVTVLRGGPDVVRVSQDGVLTAGTNTGSAVVAFGPPEKPWRHLIVYVKEVEYLMANPITQWKAYDGEKVLVLPTGLDLQLGVSFHDDEGNEFDAVRSNVVVQSDQKGLVDVGRGSENTSLSLRLLEPGATLVRIRDNRAPRRPTDFLPIHTGDLLYPSQTRISVGDVICLRLPVAFGDDASTLWTVDNPGRLRVWSELGIAMACHQGTVTIMHRLSSRLRSRIEISPIQKIELLPQPSILTTALDAVVDYPVVVHTLGDKGKKNNLVAYNDTCSPSTPTDWTPTCLPFSCKLLFTNPAASLEINSLFHSTPVFSFITGQYSCRVESIGKPSVTSATLTEAIVLLAVGSGGSVQSQPVALAFAPAIYLHQSELKVSYTKRQDTFTISGIQDVFTQLRITLSDKQLVSVSYVSATETSRTYSVTVDSAWWTLEDPPSLSLLLWSKLTGQKVSVNIKCTGHRLSPSDESWSIFPWVFLLVIAIVSIAVFFSWSRTPTKEPVVTSESPFLRSPNNQTMLSPGLNSSHEFSPTRTFDNPIYGSPFRRQFDRR